MLFWFSQHRSDPPRWISLAALGSACPPVARGRTTAPSATTRAPAGWAPSAPQRTALLLLALASLDLDLAYLDLDLATLDFNLVTLDLDITTLNLGLALNNHNLDLN